MKTSVLKESDAVGRSPVARLQGTSWGRVADAIDAAVLGGLCGVLLAGFGAAISGSPVAAVVTILAAGALGGCTARVSGAVVGAVSGGLLVALGSVVGGTVEGAVLSIAGCALLAGWTRWLVERQKEQNAAGSDDDAPSRQRMPMIAKPQDEGAES